VITYCAKHFIVSHHARVYHSCGEGAWPGLLIKVSKNECGMVAVGWMLNQGLLLAVCDKFRVDSNFVLETGSGRSGQPCHMRLVLFHCVEVQLWCVARW